VKRGARHLHALAGAYALDALDGAERDRFERHLRRCQACESEVRGFTATATALAMAATAAPPPDLKARVLAATTVTRQTAPVVAIRHHRRGAAAPRSRSPRSRWVPRVAFAVGAGGLAAAAALGVVQVSTQHQLDSAQAYSQQIATVLTAPDAALTSARTSIGGSAVVVVSRTEQRLVFTSTGLPPLPSAKVYELWLLGPGTARPAGLLPPPTGGRTAPVLASGVQTDDKVGVTVEPAGGSSSPTTTPIVVMTLPV
jgi:anti-sigma-K factor RskA